MGPRPAAQEPPKEGGDSVSVPCDDTGSRRPAKPGEPPRDGVCWHLALDASSSLRSPGVAVVLTTGQTDAVQVGVKVGPDAQRTCPAICRGHPKGSSRAGRGGSLQAPQKACVWPGVYECMCAWHVLCV